MPEYCLEFLRVKTIEPVIRMFRFRSQRVWGQVSAFEFVTFHALYRTLAEYLRKCLWGERAEAVKTPYGMRYFISLEGALSVFPSIIIIWLRTRCRGPISLSYAADDALWD